MPVNYFNEGDVYIPSLVFGSDRAQTITRLADGTAVVFVRRPDDPDLTVEDIIWNQTSGLFTLSTGLRIPNFTVATLPPAGTAGRIAITTDNNQFVLDTGSAWINVSSSIVGVVAIVNGGTGATSAAAARTNLGLGTLSVENAPLLTTKGGTGADLSAQSGALSLNAGTFVVNNVLTATRLLIAAAGNTLTTNAALTYSGTTLLNAGIIKSSSGGFTFPDNTTQTTAATASGTVTGSGASTQVATWSGASALTGSSNLTYVAGVLINAGIIKSTSGGFTFPDATTQTTAATLTGSGAVGRAAIWTGASTLSQDAAFSWDNTNKRLGLGTNAPTVLLHLLGGTQIISGNAVALPSSTGAQLQLGNANGSTTFALFDSFGAGDNTLIFRHANTSIEAPSVITNNTSLGAIQGRGIRSVGPATYSGAAASLGFFGGGTWSSTSTPTFITFGTTPASSLTLTEAMRITSAQFVGVNDAAPTSRLTVTDVANTTTGATGGATLELTSTTSNGPAVGPAIKFSGQTGTASAVFSFATIRGAKQIAGNDSSGYLGFYTTDNAFTSNERMRILANGNVGIGTGTPASLLTVAGQIEMTSAGLKFPDATTQTTAGTVAGSGASGRAAFWSATNTLSSSPNFLWNDTNKSLGLSIGSTPVSSAGLSFTGTVANTRNSHGVFVTPPIYGGAAGGANVYVSGANFLTNDQTTSRLSVTGNTTSGSAIVTNVAPNTNDLVAGMTISSAGDTPIPAATTVLSVDSGTQIHLSANANATATGSTMSIAANSASGSAVVGIRQVLGAGFSNIGFPLVIGVEDYRSATVGDAEDDAIGMAIYGVSAPTSTNGAHFFPIHIIGSRRTSPVTSFAAGSFIQMLNQVVTLTVTGSTTNGSASVTSVSDTTQIPIGQLVSGTGIPTGTTVIAKGASTLTLSALATATNVGITITVSSTTTGVAIAEGDNYQWGGSLLQNYTAGDAIRIETLGRAVAAAAPTTYIQGWDNYFNAVDTVAGISHYAITNQGSVISTLRSDGVTGLTIKRATTNTTGKYFDFLTSTGVSQSYLDHAGGLAIASLGIGEIPSVSSGIVQLLSAVSTMAYRVKQASSASSGGFLDFYQNDGTTNLFRVNWLGALGLNATPAAIKGTLRMTLGTAGNTSLVIKGAGTPSGEYFSVYQDSAAANVVLIRGDGEITTTNLSGVGNRQLCVDSTGRIYAHAVGSC